MCAKIHNVSPEMTEAIKNLRRRKGILRKNQRDLLYSYDDNLVNTCLSNGFPQEEVEDDLEEIEASSTHE